jgi:hypothetical protein
MSDENRRKLPEKAMLLLDVDGVLCPFEGDIPVTRRVRPEGFERVELPDGFSEDFVWVSRANGERLRRLGQSFEIVWATGWGDHANRVIGPFHELEHLAVIELKGSEEPTWKLPSISAYVGDERPCVWIDDDLGEDAERWAERRAGATMLVRCEPHVGLTDAIVQRCLDFAARVRSKSSIRGS